MHSFPHAVRKLTTGKLYANDSALLNGLDARMKDIEDLRDVTDNLEGLLSVPVYQGPLADMNSHKKYVVRFLCPACLRLFCYFLPVQELRVLSCSNLSIISH